MSDRPLIITTNQELLEDLLRIAAAAQVEITHAREAGSRTAWRTAGLVLIDADAVPAALARGMPRRPALVALAAAEPAAIPWDACIRLGVESTLRIGDDDDLLIALLSDAAAQGPGGGRVLAVIGGCGGAGASVFATALAVVADRRNHRALLADCDLWGPGLDVVLGVEDGTAFHWQDLAAPSGRLSLHDLRHSLPTVEVGNRGISLLCHSRDTRAAVGPDVVDVVLRSGRRAGDLVIVDLPRQPDAAADTVLDSADLVVMVTTADVRGSYGAARTAMRLADLGCEPQLVVRGPSPGGIGADDISRVVGFPVIARMRPQPSLAQELDRGRCPGSDRRGPLARAAATVLDGLGAGR